MAKNGGALPPTNDHNSQDLEKGAKFLGPLYQEPYPSASLGAYPVSGPKGGSNPSDPIGLLPSAAKKKGE